MAHTMSKDEWLAFLGAGTRTAMLATVRADGRPHVAPVWFVPDGDELVLTTGADTVKGRNLLRDGRLSLGVDDDRPPFAFVLVEGRAEISEDAAGLRTWATRIAARYMGEELAREYGRRNGVPGELLVRIRPERVIAQSGVAD